MIPARSEEAPIESPTLHEMRRDVAARSRKGLPFLIAGGIYWAGMGVAGAALPAERAALALLVGLGVVMPLAYLFSRMLGAEFAATDHPLSPLGGQIAALNGFFLPVFVVVYAEIPGWTPFTLAVLGGSHFLPYAWYFDSRAYQVLSLGMAGGSAAAAFASAATVGLGASFVAVPAVCVVAHAVAGLMLWRETAGLEPATATRTHTG